MPAPTHDIIIVGGGMVGLTLACALAEHTAFSIAVLEAKPHEPWSGTQSFHRVSAFALSSQRIFRALHVWDKIQAKRVSPFTEIHVWDARGHGEIRFKSADIAEAQLGFIIENNAVQSALFEKALTYPQIELLAPIALTAFAESEEGVTLTSADGKLFSAKLAVAADGAHSWLRQAAGIAIDTFDYDQVAIVATVESTFPHEKIARQVFLPTGPLAFLPLSAANQTSIVWSLPTSEGQALLNIDADIFKQKLEAACANCLGEFVSIHDRYAFPLRKQQTQNYVKSHVALVGDAAHTMHPLAGQGVNVGLLDAASLAEIIIDNQHFAKHLRRYERWRKADNLTMFAGVDAIKMLFASERAPIQHLRSLGLNTTQQMRWLKNMFTRHAVGNRRGLPKLAQ